MRRTRRYGLLRRAGSAVEFGLILPVLLILVTGVMEFGWFLSQLIVVSRAARDASRYGAAVYEDPNITPGTLALPAAEQLALEVLDGAGMTCNSPCDVNATLETTPFYMVVVNVSYPVEPLVGIVSLDDSIEYEFATAVEVQ